MNNEEKIRQYLETGNTVVDGDVSTSYSFSLDKFGILGPCAVFPDLSKEEQDKLIKDMAKELDEMELAVSEGRFTTKFKFTPEGTEGELKKAFAGIEDTNIEVKDLYLPEGEEGEKILQDLRDFKSSILKSSE